MKIKNCLWNDAKNSHTNKLYWEYKLISLKYSIKYNKNLWRKENKEVLVDIDYTDFFKYSNSFLSL